MRLIRILLLVVLFVGLSQDALAKKPRKVNTQRFNRRTPTEIYEQGLRAMRRGYYTRALENFNRVRNYHRDDPISVKAQLAIADVNFKKGDFEQARFAYEEFATYHPRHENLDYVTFRIGHAIYKRAPKLAGRDQGPTRSAVNVWSGFTTRFPGSAWAPRVDKLSGRARNRLAKKELIIARFYKQRRAWGAVEGRTEDLVRRYPGTTHVPAALALLGRARHAWGDVEGAREARDNLAKLDDEEGKLDRLDRVLAKEPGVKPREEVFIRPYRVRGVAQPTQGGI